MVFAFPENGSPIHLPSGEVGFAFSQFREGPVVLPIKKDFLNLLSPWGGRNCISTIPGGGGATPSNQ